MRLKSLDIKGFKSFADKTHIELDHPVTGVVGPNGCGKSNIVDAIRWVIGEHKIKSLRSDSLDDLIFNGSRTRNAAGMAEVSLTFENTRNLLPTEFTTVTISRKFYKNGESEYRLNDVACRLKDIHNLFLDTGVSNDSYAIIELGMVDDIIKDKDNSRRKMLEQAAGISIYKTRKKEATLKLNATEQDLARIEDLLFEIGNNLRTLESQAKKAERYFKIKEDYKEISVELAKASLEHFNDQYKELNEQHEQESDKKIAIETTLTKDAAVLEEDKVKLVAKEQELNGLQKQFNELVAKIRQLESDKRLAAQKIDHLKEREKGLKEFLEGADEQINKLKESIAFSEKQIQEEEVIAEQLNTALGENRTKVDEQRAAFDNKKQSLEALRATYQQKQREQFDAEKKVAVADTSVMNVQRSLQQVQSEKEQRNQLIAQLQEEGKTASEQLTNKQEELQTLVDQHEAVKGKILESQEFVEQLRAKLIDENRKLDSKSNEHDLLKSLVESLEGYPDSIKFLSKHKDWNNEAPLLSDVFVVQHEYRSALENLLDTYLNYYIVNNIDEAKAAVSLLDENKKGKANFFISSHFNQYNPAAHQAPEGVVSALSVINIDEKHKPLAQHLLGHVYIADDEAAVTNVDLENGNIIVSKSGKVIRGKYTFGGGSVGLFEGNKIGRAKNLERLAGEIETLTKSCASLKQEIADTHTLLTGFNQELNDKVIEETKREINRLENLQVNLQDKIKNYEHLNETGDERSSQLQEQLQETQEQIGDTREALEDINDALEELKTQIEEQESEFKAVEEAFNKATQAYNEQNIQYTRQQSKLDNLVQELNFRKKQHEDLIAQVDTNTLQLKQASEELEQTSSTLNKGDDELYSLMKQKEDDEATLNEKDRVYYQTRNEISEREGLINQKRREKDQVETLITSIKDKLGDMKLQLAGMKERLKVEFKVDLDAVLDEDRTTELTIEEIDAEAERLKKRLENMGEVNPTAIEAFTEMKVRHDFIVEQKQDLVNAKETLMATIEEVENTANAKFKDTFDKVRENFVKVFKALFTDEDNCDLRLTDPENVADSGVEIYAQPKGKRPSTLTQLSGGEKTLTSTAFLFAIYLIKPAPFCILDEVDAPLDDANVGKFTKMIREFSDNSQFILVTHNKQTMASVDVIYGVTMQEPGVSKLVPVDFRSLSVEN